MKYEIEICLLCGISAFEKFRSLWEKYEEFKPESIMVNKDLTNVVVHWKFTKWDKNSLAVGKFDDIIDSLCERDFNTDDKYAFNFIKIGRNNMDDEQSFNSAGKKLSHDFYIDKIIHIPNNEYIKIVDF